MQVLKYDCCMGTCIQDDCDRKAFATGLCHGHYYRKRKGLPMDTPIHDKHSETLEQRFMRQTVVTEHGLIWNAAMSGRYGQIAYGGTRHWVHRIAWELAYGPIPDGYHIDHDPACPKNCVTAGHLRCLTPSEHMKLGWERGEYDGLKGRGQCSVEGCGRVHNRRGYCEMHARRLIRTGSPLGRSGRV